MLNIESFYPWISAYHFFGSLSALCFLMTWYGLAHQVKLISRSRRSGAVNPTQGLSLNQFTSSFFAFFANFFFGIALSPFNHYLVWTRLGALLLLLMILWQIYQDNIHSQDSRSLTAKSAFWVCFVALLLGGCSVTLRPFNPVLLGFSDSIMLITAFVLAQGTVAQIRMTSKHITDLQPAQRSIFKRGFVNTRALLVVPQKTQPLNESALSAQQALVSQPMLVSLLVKDATTLAFGCTLAFNQAWPLIVLNATSLITRGWLLILVKRHAKLLDTSPYSNKLPENTQKKAIHR